MTDKDLNAFHKMLGEYDEKLGDYSKFIRSICGHTCDVSSELNEITKFTDKDKANALLVNIAIQEVHFMNLAWHYQIYRELRLPEQSERIHGSELWNHIRDSMLSDVVLGLFRFNRRESEGVLKERAHAVRIRQSGENGTEWIEKYRYLKDIRDKVKAHHEWGSREKENKNKDTSKIQNRFIVESISKVIMPKGTIRKHVHIEDKYDRKNVNGTPQAYNALWTSGKLYYALGLGYDEIDSAIDYCLMNVETSVVPAAAELRRKYVAHYLDHFGIQKHEIVRDMLADLWGEDHETSSVVEGSIDAGIENEQKGGVKK